MYCRYLDVQGSEQLLSDWANTSVGWGVIVMVLGLPSVYPSGSKQFKVVNIRIRQAPKWLLFTYFGP